MVAFQGESINNKGIGVFEKFKQHDIDEFYSSLADGTGVRFSCGAPFDVSYSTAISNENRPASLGMATLIRIA